MLIITLKILVPAIIISVWCFRQKRKTPFRAGEATSLQEEFAYYGLSREMFYVAGLSKISLARSTILSNVGPPKGQPSSLKLGFNC